MMIATAYQMKLDYLENVAIKFRGAHCLIWPFENYGSYAVLMYSGGRRNNAKEYAHRYVCQRTRGPAPARHEVAHSCGNSACLNPRHLRWDTRVGNEVDKKLHGTANRGSRHGQSKLTEQDVIYIRALKGDVSQKELARYFNVKQPMISRIQASKSWSHV